MRPRLRFGLWLAGACAALAALAAAAAALLYAGLDPESQRVLAAVAEARGPLFAFAALLVLIASAGVLRWLFARFVAPLDSLAEQATIVASANIEHRVAAGGGPEAAALARAMNRLGDAYREVSRDMHLRIDEAGARLAEERNRLAALMSELSEGVILCNGQGLILLYNEHARALFASAPAGRLATQSPVGLGRSVFAFLDRDQVAHALDQIRHGLERDSREPVTMFFTASVSGDLIRVRFAPFLAGDGEIAGLVLTCEDVTRAFGQEARRRSLLQSLATRVRRPAANVRAAAENLTAFPDMEEAERARFVEIIAAESRVLSDTLDGALRDYAEALSAGLSVEDMRLAELLAAACRRIKATPGLDARAEGIDEATWVRVDSYAVAQVLAAVAERLHEEHGVAATTFRATVKGGFVELDLAWPSTAVAIDALDRWEAHPVQVGTEHTPLAIGDVLERLGGAMWHQANPPGSDSWFRFLLPLGTPAVARDARRPGAESRPEYYDFDLFRVDDASRGLLGRPLSGLSCTVFDTETTGLEPSAGDRIVSLAAVRVVNGRALRREVFEQLVDPQRPVPRASSRIHGLRQADLAGQPTLREVLPAFHRFCEDTVLVAHNAAFDMRFLELAEAEAGVRFGQPVLDTLLLSAVVHPSQPDHGLEAIAARLGVAVVGRHTALGDALVTSEIFLRLVPLLAERGIATLGEALEASRETYYVRLQY